MSFNKPDQSLIRDVALNLEEIDTYDSCHFGKLLGPEHDSKRELLKKGICHYEKLATAENQPDAQIYCKLGHLQLLLEDYNKALSAYNKYIHLQKNYWKNSPFLFGLGIVYYHFSAYDWTVKLFQQLLYNDPGFCRINEVHCRLGLVFKITGNHIAAIKHFCRSLLDCKTCSITKSEIRFHLGHLFEIQGKFVEAKREYELIIELPAAQVKPFVQASTFRQLGWMYHSVEELGDATARAETALKYLQRSIEIDPNNGHTWYYLGRYYSSMGKVHDAFVSYRQSIDKSEANADTWCSIGVLYQEQNQPMDALQAYICAVQLDRSHQAAWRDLAILYEACQQPKDALVCYMNAQHCLKNKSEHLLVEDLNHRIASLKEHALLLTDEHANKNRILPSIEEAWTLPIPAELSQRQSAFRCPPSQKKPSHSERGNERVSSEAASLTPLHPSITSVTTTRLTSLPGSTSHSLSSPSTSGSSPSKRRKVELQSSSDLWQSPSWYLTPPQMQVLQNLRLNHSILTPHQQLELERLEHNHALMTKHQKIVKEDAEKKQSALLQQPPSGLPSNVPVATAATSLPGNSTSVTSQASISPHSSLPSSLSCNPAVGQLQPPTTQNGTSTDEKENSPCSKSALVKKLLGEQTSPVLKQVNCVNGAFSPNSISTVEPLPPTSTSNLSGYNHLASNGPIKGVMGDDESKSQYSKLAQESCAETRPSEDGKYNSVMDTPQDTPSSDSSLLLPATAHPLQLQAQLSNHVKHLSALNCQVASVKPSPPSSLTSRHSGDVVLSPNALVHTTDCEQTGNKPAPSDIPDYLDPLEKLANSLSTIPGRPLPPLLCPIGIPDDIPAREVITTCRKLTCNGLSSKHYYLDKCPPPSRPKRTNHMVSKEDLSPPAPTIYLENKKEAMSRALADFCTNPKNPVTVIRGLAAALKLDLGLFSTKTLVESNPDCTVEVRTQVQQPSEENWDSTGTSKVWLCESNRSYTSIAKYAQYQATTFQEQLQEEESKKSGQAGGENKKNDDMSKQGGGKKKTFKTIKFGTNIDLSNEKKWRPQLQELAKLPWLFRLVSAGNMLSHVGHNILGMNTIQLYMKVPGSRTPGHQENNNYSAININIGPGDCEWFAVPEEYWGEIDQLCAKHDIDYLSGSWWPILEDLYRANIPVYRFIQKPGDMVWLNAGTVHWVQAVGWCNNIAWNVGLVSAYQYQMSIERYEWNKFSGYKSIVPLVQLTWNMAQHVRVADSKLFSLMKTCMMRSLWQCQQTLDNLKCSNIEVIFHGKNPDEPSHYCESCDVEVFNLLFVRRSDNLQTHLVHCSSCARNISSDLENFVVLNQYHTDELMRIYDQFCLAKKSKT